jgi:D-aminoacyl-tRNA deacylase
MLAVVQRVSVASVVVDGREVGAIGRGLLVLVGVHRDDTDADTHWMASRLIGLRIFPDAAGKMNLSLGQLAPHDGGAPGGLLLIPNFTLCADTRKGHRPSFIEAMEPARASAMFDDLRRTAAASGLPVATGVFGADMRVTLTNEGPVTILLDSAIATRPGPG